MDQVDKLLSNKGTSIYIYGAHTRARNLMEYLNTLYPCIDICNFIVSDKTDNPKEIEHISVITLDELQQDDTEKSVFIATKGEEHLGITVLLQTAGFDKIMPVTVEMDNDFRNRYCETYFLKNKMNFIKFHELTIQTSKKKLTEQELCIYMAKSIYDKKVENEAISSYIKPIQAGAALTSQEIALLQDNVGLNISDKNRQYSELTALYWMWKHGKEEYQGLCHYRRQFLIADEELQDIESKDVDVILPVPSISVPSIQENYGKRHDRKDWEHLIGYLKKYLPEYASYAKNIFEGKIYFPCNMFIMKRKILDKYCEWLFPILDAMEKEVGEKADTYQNRYIGFMAERLMTLYFMFHYNEYKIVYLDKTFLR